jgi:hypothetical protein
MKKVFAILAVAGLMTACNNAEKTEVAVDSTVVTGDSAAAVTYIVGNAALGGIIAYILVSGDPGYDANVQHGLVASTADLSSAIQWHNGTHTTTGATATAIGTGLANTNTIIANQGATRTNYAAGLARAHTGGGYTDWFLPSKDELNKLYLNQGLVGGFAYASYWSSSESSNGGAWDQLFISGYQFHEDKFNTYYVRAVRAF